MAEYHNERRPTEEAINDAFEQVRALLTQPGVYSFHITTEDKLERRGFLVDSSPLRGSRYGEPLDENGKAPCRSITIAAHGHPGTPPEGS